MKIKLLFTSILFFTLTLLGTAQNSNYSVKTLPNPFDSLLTYEITVKEGDTVLFETFDQLGNAVIDSENIVCMNNII